jgi:hypothetical protein
MDKPVDKPVDNLLKTDDGSIATQADQTRPNRKFCGFTMLGGAWMPPEVIHLLPALNSSDLKILLVIIFRFMQIGGNQPLTYQDMVKLTGLSERSVCSALPSLMRQGLITRLKLASRTFIYEPSLRFNMQNLQPNDTKLIKLSKEEKEREIKNDSSYSSLLKTLRSYGVYAKTARWIIRDFDSDYIQVHIDYYVYAFRKGLAKSGGWLVESIHNNWPPPVGFFEDYRNQTTTAYRHRYTVWNIDDDHPNEEDDS